MTEAPAPMRIPIVTKLLLIGCVLIFMLQSMDRTGWLLWHLALWPLGMPSVGSYGEALPQFMPWQLLSYGFMHGSPMHLIFNLFALWMFGSELERYWGSAAYLRYILVGIIGAGLTQLAVGLLGGPLQPTIGISGAVYAVLLGIALMFPNMRVMLLFPPIPMRARTMVILYACIELYLGVFTSNAGVAHFAHLGGLATGWLMIQYWRGQLPIKPRLRLMA